MEEVCKEYQSNVSV